MTSTQRFQVHRTTTGWLVEDTETGRARTFTSKEDAASFAKARNDADNADSGDKRSLAGDMDADKDEPTA